MNSASSQDSLPAHDVLEFAIEPHTATKSLAYRQYLETCPLQTLGP
jgi:hypothetical protein